VSKSGSREGTRKRLLDKDGSRVPKLTDKTYAPPIMREAYLQWNYARIV